MRRMTIALSISIALLAGCGGGGGSRQERTVTIKGSDTMVILGQRWAERYMAAHQGAVIQVTGGGTGTGIAALINGTTDICQASRPMKDSEKQQVQSKFGAPPHEIVVAKDGLAVYLHAQNPVTELTIAQLRDVYTGAVTSWKALGGPEAPIVLYGRENSSGTYEYFKEHVLQGADFAAATQTLPGTAAVVSAVSQDPNGIGYGGGRTRRASRNAASRPTPRPPRCCPRRTTCGAGHTRSRATSSSTSAASRRGRRRSSSTSPSPKRGRRS
jgi:phosphate transport system substrate-binding protein